MRCAVSPFRLPQPFSNRPLLLLAVLTTVLLSGCYGSPRSARRGDITPAPYWPKPVAGWQPAEFAALHVELPEIAGAEFVKDDSLCMTCHETYAKSFQHNVHRGQSCEQCHGPASRHLQTRGKEPGLILSFKTLPPPQRAELCLRCHESDACLTGGQWRTSPHAHNGVTCTDCHTSHYNVPPGTAPTQLADSRENSALKLTSYSQEEEGEVPVDQQSLRDESHHLGAISPNVCYRCHANMARQEDIAHPHQICGANDFDCATCHNPHGQIRVETRSDLCLKCHDGAPTMAWHSSIHALNGVGCVDCHNPHPNSTVQPFVDIQHTNIDRPRRMTMSVDEPRVCYKCHADIYAKTSMPSHHPIKEGKLLCSDCHDGHGQTQDNLKEPTVNMVCYRCHAEKQGPFVWEHPPVSENCAICHEPHGTVANNLMRQPTTFICLRCHTGHRTGPTGPNHAPLLGDVGTDPKLQRAFYTDCSQCHNQIHGSDLPSPHTPHVMFR